jgi:hypothetical protein
MPTNKQIQPGATVVVVDQKDPNYMQEGLVALPYTRPENDEDIYVLIDGDYIWYHSWQLRSGRLVGGVCKVYLSLGELRALIRATPYLMDALPVEMQAALAGSPPPHLDVFNDARCNVAAAFLRATDYPYDKG